MYNNKNKNAYFNDTSAHKVFILDNNIDFQVLM